MHVFAVLLAYVVVVFVDPVGVYKKEERKDFYVCCVLCVISFGLAMMLALSVRIPSLNTMIEQWMKVIL